MLNSDESSACLHVTPKNDEPDVLMTGKEKCLFLTLFASLAEKQRGAFLATKEALGEVDGMDAKVS